MESINENKLTIKQLIKMLPYWCEDGELVYADKDDHSEVGIIIEYCIIDPEDMSLKEYDDMLETNEWLMISVATPSGISGYYLDEIKPYKHK